MSNFGNLRRVLITEKTPIPHVRGATFRHRFTLTQRPSGLPLDLSNATVSCSVAQSVSKAGSFSAALSVTPTGTPGEVEVWILVTDSWPVGLLHSDLKIQITGGDRLYTGRFSIDVSERVTP